MTEDNEGGYLVPHEYAYGGWIYTTVPRKDWQRIFYYLSRILRYITLLISRLDWKIRPHGMTQEKKRIKGILERLIEEHELVRKATRYDLPQEPYGDLLFGREHNHDLR